MKKFVFAMMAAFGSVALAGAVAACGSHGSTAGTHFRNWVASNTEGTGSVSSANFSSTGSQGVTGAGTQGGWANSEYWIDITLPDGTSVTVKAYADSNGSEADGHFADSSRAGVMEAWLFDQAQKELRSWFNNYEPADIEGDDYCG